MLSRNRFFFFADTLERERRALRVRFRFGATGISPEGLKRTKSLIKRHSGDLTAESRRMASYLCGLAGDSAVSKKEDVTFDDRSYRYTFILDCGKDRFILRCFAGLEREPFVAVNINGVDRKFYDNGSLVDALRRFDGVARTILKKIR